MAHRTILTQRQRAALFNLPTDPILLEKYYTLDDEDLEHIADRRRSHNKLGFALQLCAFRYPGRLLTSEETIPLEVISFIAKQVGIKADDLSGYAEREETRHEHLISLRSLYGFQAFSDVVAKDFRQWLNEQAIEARSNEDLARRFVDRCRELQIILPAITTIERLCAEALVKAEKHIDHLITSRLSPEFKVRLDALLEEKASDKLSLFVWLRQYEVGSNSAGAVRLMDRLERLQGLKIMPSLIEDIPAHRVQRLRRHGERYFANDLSNLSEDRRYAILAVSAIEWQSDIADTLVETHDRIVGKTWREAKQVCNIRIKDAKAALQETLTTFKKLGSALIEAHEEETSLEQAVETSAGWSQLRHLVAETSRLTSTVSAEPIAHIVDGYFRFRRYVPRMLSLLEIEAVSACKPLLQAIEDIRSDRKLSADAKRFVRPNTKWHRHLRTGNERDWEVAVFCHIRDAFRSGDLWLKNSKRFADLKQSLVPVSAIIKCHRLAVPIDVETFLADRKLQW